MIYAGINITRAVSSTSSTASPAISTGHAGFMSVGAYVRLSHHDLEFQAAGPGVRFPAPGGCFLLRARARADLAAAVLGYLVGLPSPRLKGDYLAIVTLGFGEIIRVLILNIDAMGGASGMTGVPAWSNFGGVYAVAFISFSHVSRIWRVRTGARLLAVREDEIAAEAMGVNTTRYKVPSFVIGAFFAGVAGGLYAHFLTFLSPQAFDFNRSFEIIIMVVLGGMGSTTGAIIAALFLTGLREALRPLQEITRLDFRMVIYSLMLVVLMLTRPNGLFGTKELSDFGIFRRFRKDPLKLAKGAPAEVASG